MTVNNFMQGANFGMGISKHARDVERQKTLNKREDEAWDRQKLIDERNIAVQDLNLALRNNDFELFAKSAQTLSLKVPEFKGEKFAKHKETMQLLRNGEISVADPRVTDLANAVFQHDLSKRENANPNFKYRINTVVPAPNADGFQFILDVKDTEKGAGYSAPMTIGATVGGGEAQTVKPGDLMKRFGSFLQVGDAIHADPEMSKEFDQVIEALEGQARQRFEQNTLQQARYNNGIEQRPVPKTHVINGQIVEQGAGENGGYGVVFDGRDTPESKPPETKEVNGVLLQWNGSEWAPAYDGREESGPETKTVNGQLLERQGDAWVLAYDGRDSDAPKREMKEDVNGRWRYVDDQSLVFPDVEALPDSSGNSAGNTLSFDKEVYKVFGNALGFRIDSLGSLISGDDYDVENEEVLTQLSSIASEYAKGKNISHTTAVNEVMAASSGLTLKMADAVASVTEELGVSLDPKMQKKNPEEYAAIEQQINEAARLKLERDMKILQSRLSSESSTGSSDYSHLW